MSGLSGRNVLLGVTGGIAAYKAAELLRLLTAAGAEVRVVMTAAAQRFVAPLTFQALSGRPVRCELFDEAHEAAMGHIELARWADLVLIAPASADFLARMANGLADDLLSTLCLATAAPVAVAPAMNRQMWANAATRENIARLRLRGVALMGPAEGAQACGEDGPGRMMEPVEIAERAGRLFGDSLFGGIRVLLTAGPTREPLDPVRFLGNRSSGKMGYALAEAFVREGARVTLVSGPTALPAPAGVERISVESALQMHEAVMARVGDCELFVACAAVADYRPAEEAPQKIKKGAKGMRLKLVRNPDILSDVAARSPRPFTVGFAAETERLAEYAEAKRLAKGVDMIAANLVGEGRLGFETDDNALLVLWQGGSRSLPAQPKAQLARQLVDLVAERLAVPCGSAELIEE